MFCIEKSFLSTLEILHFTIFVTELILAYAHYTIEEEETEAPTTETSPPYDTVKNPYMWLAIIGSIIVLIATMVVVFSIIKWTRDSFKDEEKKRQIRVSKRTTDHSRRQETNQKQKSKSYHGAIEEDQYYQNYPS